MSSRESAIEENRLSALAGIRDVVEKNTEAIATVMAKAKTMITIRDLDIDTFADGILAHRRGEPFNAFLTLELTPLAALSWRMGWNERALKDKS